MEMFRCNSAKPGRRLADDPSLALVIKAIAHSEKYLEEDKEQARNYLAQAERLYNHWRAETAKEDYNVHLKLFNLWIVTYQF